MNFLKRLSDAWSVLIGTKYASKRPAKGLKRNRKQGQIPFRIVEGEK